MRYFAALVMVVVAFFATLRSAEAAANITIDLSSQTMVVSAGDGQSYSWPISSARSGFSTPRGYYRPQRLEKMHYSRKYHNSPMPHSIFFRGGYAIHGTGAVSQLGRPASHGCIRLAPANAAQLYAIVKQEGARIQISGTPPGLTRLATTAHQKPAHKKAFASNHHRHKRTHYVAARAQQIPIGYAPVPYHYPAPVKKWQYSPLGWYAR